MNVLDRLSIRNKVIAAFLAVLAAALVLGLFSIDRIARVNDAASEIDWAQLPNLIAVHALRTAMFTYRGLEARHIIAVESEVMAKIDEDLEKAASAVQAGTERLSQGFASAPEADLSAEIGKKWTAYRIGRSARACSLPRGRC